MISKILGLVVIFSLSVFSGQLQSQGNSPVQQAKTLLQQGEIEKAKQILQKHLKEHPKDVAGLLLMGKMEKEGEISLGYFKDVQKSSDVDRRSQEANLQIANYYYIKGQYLTAIELLLNFKKQFASSDFLPQVVWILGEAYLATEQIPEARAEFEFLSSNYPSARGALQGRKNRRGDRAGPGLDFKTAAKPGIPDELRRDDLERNVTAEPR